VVDAEVELVAVALVELVAVEVVELVAEADFLQVVVVVAEAVVEEEEEVSLLVVGAEDGAASKRELKLRLGEIVLRSIFVASRELLSVDTEVHVTCISLFTIIIICSM
jgi:hypothetical protein